MKQTYKQNPGQTGVINDKSKGVCDSRPFEYVAGAHILSPKGDIQIIGNRMLDHHIERG